jgi:hypothetical protein
MRFRWPGFHGGVGPFQRARMFFTSPRNKTGIVPETKPRVRIGVVGYSGHRFDEDKARELIDDAYGRAVSRYPHHDVTVVSGLTNLGIPKIAYEQAVRRGWRTEGVASKEAAGFERFPVDDVQIVGDTWGDESETFVNGIDTLIRVGGGKQALAETEAFKRLGRPLLEYELPPAP